MQNGDQATIWVSNLVQSVRLCSGANGACFYESGYVITLHPQVCRALGTIASQIDC